MERQFVLIEDGVEIEWIDPVLGFRETEDGYWVENGYGTYWFSKGPGVTYKFRTKEYVDGP